MSLADESSCDTVVIRLQNTSPRLDREKDDQLNSARKLPNRLLLALNETMSRDDSVRHCYDDPHAQFFKYARLWPARTGQMDSMAYIAAFYGIWEALHNLAWSRLLGHEALLGRCTRPR